MTTLSPTTSDPQHHLPAAEREKPRDAFDWLDRMNRASAVMLREEGIVTGAQAATIARAIVALFDEAALPGFRRSGLYIEIEPRLLEIGGADVSRLHTGRSSIDTGRTGLRLLQRDLLLDLFEALAGMRQIFLGFSGRHSGVIIPAYTLGVQAQPTTVGHYLAGYLGVFERHADLLRDTYRNIDRSPLGAAALGTSSYPVNRVRLAELLGFGAPIRNSFDAVQLATLETSMRIVGATSAIAMTASELLSDIENQYRMSRPWLTLPPELTGGSSIMPQKLNPMLINDARMQASRVLGYGVSYMLGSHKAASGDMDLMFSGPNEALQETAALITGLGRIFSVLRVDEQRALDEVLDDYATATELANILQSVSGIAFREAHHLSAALVRFGRNRGLRPTEIAFTDFETVFADAAAELGLSQPSSGLSEETFRQVMSPQNMVTSSKGLGGPQPQEVEAMLRLLEDTLLADRDWLAERRGHLRDADAALDRAFHSLLDP